MHGARRAAAALVCAALAAGAGAGAAQAGTATGRPAQFTAGAGERNDLTVEAGSAGRVQFVDAAEPIGAALPWCVPFPLGQALCDPDGDPRDTDGGGVGVDLGDDDDRAVLRFVPGTPTQPGRIRVAAGPGNDRVENFAFASVRLDGGEGDDTVVSGRAAGAYLLGGPGADVLTSSGDCCAVAGYSDHAGSASGISITLDRLANDGTSGERDDVRTNHVIGSPGADVITGGARADSLIGGGGADVIDGGAGADTINTTLEYAQSFESPAADDRPDNATCGAGDDDVIANADDEVAVDCEHIRVGVPVAPALVLVTRTARADSAGIVKLTYRLSGAGDRTDAAPAQGTLRLVDSQGRAVTSRARYVLSANARRLRLRVRLRQATRARLATDPARPLRLTAQAVTHGSGPGAVGASYETLNVPMTVTRAAARR